MKDTKLPIAVWLGMLPEPMRKKAIKAHLNETLCDSEIISQREVETLSRAIHSAFVWDATKEGHKYWQNYHNELKSQNL